MADSYKNLPVPTPTNNPVPSADIRDHVFGGSKIDEFVTSMGWTYTDRFGQKHYTIEGINYLSQQAMAAYGYVILTGKTFTTGATLNNPNEVLLNTPDGEYYKWTGSFASGGKVVPANSTPSGTGGIGPGAWVGVGDASLRAALAAPGGVNLVNGAAKQSDLDDTNAIVDKINYAQYPRVKELAKLMTAGLALNIKLFGDSTAWGSLPPDLTETTNPPYKMLKEALLAVTGISNNVMRYAIPGTTLYDMLRGTDGSGKTYEQRLIESPCDVVYCNHCINDNQTGKDLHQYRLDLIEFVRISRSHNAVPVLITPNPQTTILIGTPANSKRFPLFVEVMREVAKNMSVDLVDNNYYMTKSLNVFNVNTIFPDGVHMSNAAYRQYGYNLAIPFIACHTLHDTSSRAGINGTQWFTNSTNSQISQHGARCGETVSWEKESQTTGINFPVILDYGVKSLLINQLQWGSASRANSYINNSAASVVYPNRNLGNTSTLNWDSLTKINLPMFAGLNVIGLLIDIAGTSLGTGMTFSGVMMSGKGVSSMTSVAGDYYANDTLCNNDFISFNYNLVNGTECAISDDAGGKVASIKKTGTAIRGAIFKDGVEVSGLDIATSAADGIYQIIFRVVDTGIQFFVGVASGTINTTSTPSNLKLSASSANFSLVRDL